MIQPKPYKLKCPKCGYTKIVKPESDALNPMDLISTCPKCGADMERNYNREEDNTLFDIVKGLFTKK